MTETQIIILLVGIALSAIIALNNAFGLRDRFIKWKKEKQHQKNEKKINSLSLELDKKFQCKNINELEFVIDEYYRYLKEEKKPTVNFKIDGYDSLISDIEMEKKKSKPDREKLLRLNNVADIYKIADLKPNIFLNDLIHVAVSNLYKNPNTVNLSSKEITKVIYESLKRFAPMSNEQEGKKFDIFHRQISNWYFWILLSEDELNDLMKKQGVQNSQQLTRNWGLDFFDLSHDIQIQKVFPSMVYEYLGLKYGEHTEEPKAEEFFNTLKWKVGLG